ncbi:hypothetical protein LZ318_34060 [Saccharopolyspora indica]|uniref:hypothetical protein n=1 Tax=Saccharopolyspora indica TaxID=1229659 RepID=UPI0022EACA7C|nr:hypothetical protein [Saccharopolyspora indica]MDA3647492.1 hypothetical protein [Saccharopolyspora indica]
MGHYQYSSEQLNEIARVGKREVEEANNIWSDVITQIQGLFPSGSIDAGLSSVLEDRNAKYVREIGNYAEALQRQSQATNNINDLAVEGGAQMRKHASL